MPTSSAGILMYRRTGKALEVLLVHPGGPFWRNEDDGAWSNPKAKWTRARIRVALREFMEEIGSAPDGPLRSLGEIRQRGGKRVHAFAIEGDIDAGAIASNTFEIEWPPKSGTSSDVSGSRSRRMVRFAGCACENYREPAVASRSAHGPSSLNGRLIRKTLRQPTGSNHILILTRCRTL
jgi:predicted NUDIX family NTP pyrophosphohydrolase